MKLLVVSDNHGWGEILSEIMARYKGKVDGFYHCGDSELYDHDPEMAGYTTVRGNCDTENRFPYELVEVMEGKRIFLTHGHRYQVKTTMMNLHYKAKEYRADFVFFGHTHMLGVEKVDETIYLNPGSISMPKGRMEKTYAIVEVGRKEVIIRFFNDLHEELLDLQQIFSL
ncbi:putative phosphoesterase [Oikeobacillus pervagus]|uniref:Phosphoesterase n=1 Tax=Oikeobacillus pervagus TaxID=1325931 RepID=A0AAJ1T566_9BACI|nr:metallophosphoesterase [Oikeobacillus pervagus]MDQ0215421.1 putative phosphoesterase [Oikeobacillus pervagus]